MNIPPSQRRAVSGGWLAAAITLTLSSYAYAQTCGKICSPDFWATATPIEISSAIAQVNVNARDKLGRAPLHTAALIGKLENIIAFLKAGADVNAKSGYYSFTPLHSAALHGTPENVIVLLKAGADAKARATDAERSTPWDFSQYNDKLKGTDAYWALNDARFK